MGYIHTVGLECMRMEIVELIINLMSYDIVQGEPINNNAQV